MIGFSLLNRDGFNSLSDSLRDKLLPGMVTQTGYKVLEYYYNQMASILTRLNATGSNAVPFAHPGFPPSVLLDPDRYEINSIARNRHMQRSDNHKLKIQLLSRTPWRVRRLLRFTGLMK